MVLSPGHAARFGALLRAAVHPARGGQHGHGLAGTHGLRGAGGRGLTQVRPERVQALQRLVQQVGAARPVAFVGEHLGLHGAHHGFRVPCGAATVLDAGGARAAQHALCQAAHAAAVLGRTRTGPEAGRQRPGRVVAAATSEGATDQFARGGIAGRVEPGHRGGAIVAHHVQATRAAHRAFQPQRHREVVAERVDALPVERHEEVRLRVAHPGADLCVGLVEAGEHRLRLQGLRDDAAPARRAGPFDWHAIAVVEGGPVVEQRLGDGRKRRSQSIGVGELHARELGTGLGGHQVTVAGEHVAAQRAAQEGAAAGGDHHRTRAHYPGLARGAGDAGGARHAPAFVGEQLQRGAVVEDARTGLLHLLAHQAHVLGALQGRALQATRCVDRERVAPFGQGFGVDPGLLQHAVHPRVLGEFATHGEPAGLGVLARVLVARHVPQARARWRGGARGATEALVHQRHAGAARGGGHGGPGTGGPAANDQDIGLDLLLPGGAGQQRGRKGGVRHRLLSNASEKAV